MSSYSDFLLHFSELLTEPTLAFRFEPTPFTTATMASEIPAAINPYSIAVAPHLARTSKQNVSDPALIFPGTKAYIGVPDRKLAP